MKESVDMSFKEMFIGLYETDFLFPVFFETICNEAETYAEAKRVNLFNDFMKLKAQNLKNLMEIQRLQKDNARMRAVIEEGKKFYVLSHPDTNKEA